MLSILPPFAERHEEPIIVFCYCCWLVFVLFPDTISRQRTPSWIRSVVSFFPFSFNENATTAHKRYTRIPVSSMKHNKTIALNKLAKSIFLLSLSVYLCRSRHCMCVCVCIMYDFQWNELNWKKNRSTESEMNAEGMLRCKHCKHFLFQFSMYEYVLMACLRYSMMIQTHTLTEIERCASSSSSSSTIFIFHFHSFLAPVWECVSRSIRWSTLCVCVCSVKSCRIFDWPWPRYLSHSSSSSYFCTFPIYISIESECLCVQCESIEFHSIVNCAQLQPLLFRNSPDTIVIIISMCILCTHYCVVWFLSADCRLPMNVVRACVCLCQ